MSYLDLLLNIVGLLIWVNWRSLSFMQPARALTLAAAAKPTERARQQRWPILLALPIMLALRAVFYWQFGPALDWVPKLRLGMLIVSFNLGSNYWRDLARVEFFSLCSFVQALLVFYACLFLLSALARKIPDADIWAKMVRLHLWRLGYWPAWAQLLLPFVFILATWPACGWLLAKLGFMPTTPHLGPLFIQGAVLAVGLLIFWKYFLLGLLLLYFLNSYIYFGSSAIWEFLNAIGRTLLRPLQWMQIAKADLAPVGGIAILFGLGELFSHYLMPRLYQLVPW